MHGPKFKRNVQLALGIIVLPMIVAIIYYIFFSMDRYVSSAQVVVRQAGSNNASQQVPGISLLLGGAANPASREETLYLREYINSIDMLNVLEKNINWKQHYASQWNDPLFWVGEESSRESLLKYYRRLVKIHYDELTGLLSIEVQALTPEFSEQTLQVILSQSERFVNEISHRMARDQVRFAEEELGRARQNYENNRDEMIRFQSANNLLDAQASAESRATIVASLDASLATERATLKGLISSLNADAPQVRQQRIRIAALEKQLETEKKTLVSSADGEQLNVVAARYKNLMLNSGITEEAYKLSVTALENSRIEASKKIRSLVTVVSPNMPEEAIYPRRAYNLLTLFIILLFIYGITRFIIASIEDHRD